VTSIVSFNANGIRSAQRKGFFDWLARTQPDIVCIQETRAQTAQLSDPVFWPEPYHCYYNEAQRKGYAGTAVYSRVEPRAVVDRLGWEPADSEGRYLQCDYGNVSVVSLYMPSGSSNEQALARKFVFMEHFFEHLAALRRREQAVIICADWNTCHKEIDLKNWRGNRKNSGFLPEERAWLDRVYDELGYRDAFRLVEAGGDQYTWWSNRGQARAKNVGWRIDYQVISPCLIERVRAASIYREENFSDHAPQVMEYALTLSP